MRGAAQTLAYLARYTHRTALSNERIRALRTGEQADQVAWSVRADAQGAKRVAKLEGAQFIGRFLSHVLPSGVKRIRHYGLLAAGQQRAKLAAARRCLQMPASHPVAAQSAEGFMMQVARLQMSTCPECGDKLRITQTLACQRRLPAPRQSSAPQHRQGAPP